MIVLSKGKYLGSVNSATSTAGVLMSITDYHADQGMSLMHYHENPHLSFVLKGNMCVTRKHLSGSRQALESYSFMRSGEIHQNSIQSKHCKNLNLELEPEFFLNYGIQEGDITSALGNDKPGAALLMVRLYKELRALDGNFSDSVHMLLLGASAGWKHEIQQFPPWVRTVRDLLNDKWNEPITLHDVALAADVHPVTVCKYFSRYFGASFGEYRRKLKVERAVCLIAAGNVSLTEVSYACGFSDQSHFIRTFKEFTTMLPKEFRSV